jgi:putative ABC transport system permease protein
MPSLLRRFKYLLDPGRAERDLAEEIETHRAMTERRLRASGLSDAEAAAESRRVMGNATLAREDARAAWVAPWVDSVWQDIAYALRILRRAPGFAAAMIFVMALGIGATTGVFGLVDGVVLRSLPVHEPARLVYFSQPSFSYPVLLETRARGAGVLSSLAAWDMDRQNVAWVTELEPTEILMASGNFYSTLGIGAAIGRTFGDDDDAIGGGREGLVAVISHDAWQRRFRGDPTVIGRTLRIEQHTFTIIGVTPAGFFGVAPGLAPEVTIPLTSTARVGQLTSTSSSWVHLLGRLHDGVSLSAANAALRTFWHSVLEATTNPGMPKERRAVYLARTTSLESGSAGYSRVRNQFAEPLWVLLALVTLLLTVACASAANLMLARGVSRQREIAVRLAIGASRHRLIRQMLTESLVWTCLASAVGLLFALWSAGTLVALMTTTQEQIVVDLSLNWRILGFAVALAFVTAFVCSAVPAFSATRLDPGTGLKETGQISNLSPRRWSLGTSLVAAQVALTVLLLFGASLFVRSLGRVLAEDTGYVRQGVLVLATDVEAVGYEGQKLVTFYQQLHERLAGIAGVQSASLSLYPPVSDEDGAWTQNIATDGNAVPDTPGQSSVYFNAVSSGYFDTIGLPLVGGRDFSIDDAASADAVVIVNESLARRFFPNQNAVGRQITMGRNKNRRDLRVVGIVRDSKYQRLQEETRSIAYIPYTQHPVENLFAEIRTSGPVVPVVASLRREVRALDAVVPIRIETVADRIRESLVTERVIAMLATALGLAALLLACAGLYGMLAYAVSRRTREIGLRLALGAERGHVLRTIISQSLVLAGLGIAAGLGCALALGQFARNLLFQVSPRDPLSLGAAAAIMLIVACLAAFLPARRASRVDPVVALRCE